jgi:hypothetical protein
MGWLAALGTLSGIGGNIYGAYQSGKDANALQKVANKPVDWRQFYQPMSDAARTAYTSSLTRGGIGRGLSPDSGALASLVGQGMAGMESDQVYKAMELAGKQQGLMVDAYGRSMGGRGNALAGIGNVGALPNYLAGHAQRYDNTQARQRQEAMTKQWMDHVRSAIQTGDAATQSMRIPNISYPQNQTFSGDIYDQYETDYNTPAS